MKNWSDKAIEYNQRILKALMLEAHCGGLKCQECICVERDLCQIFKHEGQHKTEAQHQAMKYLYQK